MISYSYCSDNDNDDDAFTAEAQFNTAVSNIEAGIAQANAIAATYNGYDAYRAQFETLKNGELPLVVDLWAPWCGPCKMVGPVISELARDYDGKIVVGKCDVDEEEDVAMELGVRNIPTILFFKGGEIVDKFVGAAPKSVLDAKFKALLA